MTGSTCRKCGRGSMSEPRFRRGYHPCDETLSYSCSVCGYTETTPTKDAIDHHRVLKMLEEKLGRRLD